MKNRFTCKSEKNIGDSELQFDLNKLISYVKEIKSVKNANTPVITECIVTEIDNIVKLVRFLGWQNTNQGRNDEKAIKSIYVKKRIFNKLFKKAYSYVEQYY